VLGPRQGADGEEHGDRAGRLQGRLRAEARPPASRSRRLHEGRRRLLPGLSARPARLTDNRVATRSCRRRK
jgi:hypothetical protein